MDTSIETLMKQYTEMTRKIDIYEQFTKNKLQEIDVLTQKIRPNKWLNKVDENDEMFKLYCLKMQLIDEYDDAMVCLERYKATLSIQLNIIKGKEYRM